MRFLNPLFQNGQVIEKAARLYFPSFWVTDSNTNPSACRHRAELESVFGPGKVGPGKVGPGKVGLEKVGLEKVGPVKVGLEKVGLEKVGPGKVGLEKVGPGKVGPENVGPGKVGPEKVGPGKVGPEKVGAFSAFFAASPCGVQFECFFNVNHSFDLKL